MKEFLTSTISLSASAIVMLWCIVDANTRLVSPVTHEQVTKKITPVDNIHLPTVNQAVVDKVTSLYQQYKQSEQANAKSDSEINVLSAEQQAQQTGELTSVYAGNKRLILKAVIADKTQSSLNVSLVALIEVENLENGNKTIEQFDSNSSVYGYQLSVLSNTQVQLIKDDVKPAQQIVLTMYKTRT